MPFTFRPSKISDQNARSQKSQGLSDQDRLDLFIINKGMDPDNEDDIAWLEENSVAYRGHKTWADKEARAHDTSAS